MWDGIFFEKMAKLLSEKIIGAKINNVFSVEDKVILHLYRNHSFYLVFSFKPNYFLIKEDLDSKVSSSTHFTNLLKTHLKGEEIKDTIISKNDRVLRININDQYCLILEYLGKDNNLILTREDLIILGCYNNVKYNEKTSRTLLPSYKYSEVKPLQLKNIYEDEYNGDITEFYGIGRNLKTIIKTRLEKEDFSKIIKSLKDSKVLYENDGLIHFLAIDEQESGEEPFTFLASYYSNKKDENNQSVLFRRLTKVIKSNIEKLEINISKREEDLDKLQNYDELITKGNLLLTYQSKLNNDKEEVVLDDISIKLDRDLSILENANNYFEKAKKSKRSIEPIKQLIADLKNKLDYLKGIEVENSYESLIQLERELIKNNYIRVNARGKEVSRSSIKEYFYKDTKISVGKSSSQNEYLTLKRAKPNEYFFHVADFPGAHVILHHHNPSSELIEYAAKIAVKHSKLSDEVRAKVHYCQVKYVRKIKNSKKGQVSLRNYKSITVQN